MQYLERAPTIITRVPKYRSLNCILSIYSYLELGWTFRYALRMITQNIIKIQPYAAYNCSEVGYKVVKI